MLGNILIYFLHECSNVASKYLSKDYVRRYKLEWGPGFMVSLEQTAREKDTKCMQYPELFKWMMEKMFISIFNKIF